MPFTSDIIWNPRLGSTVSLPLHLCFFFLLVSVKFPPIEAVHLRALANSTVQRELPVGEAAKEATQDSNSLPSYDIVLVVPQASKQGHVRQIIRHSWGQYLNASAVNCTPCIKRKTKLLFVVGHADKDDNKKDPVKLEAKLYDDVGILTDFTDQQAAENPAEMTQRSIRYALEHFRFKYLMRVQYTSWVYVDRLLGFLETRDLFDVNISLPGVYAGNFTFEDSSSPARHEQDESTNALLKSITGSGAYPLHARGGNFILSADLCEFIAGMGAASEDLSGAPKWGEDYGWAPVPRLAMLPDPDASVGFWLLAVNHTKLRMPITITRTKSCGAALSAQGEPVVEGDLAMEEILRRGNRLISEGRPCDTRSSTASDG